MPSRIFFPELRWFSKPDHLSPTTNMEDLEFTRCLVNPRRMHISRIRKEPIEPLEWKAPKNRLNPSIKEQTQLELKELPDHLEYAFLQEGDQLPVFISSSLTAHEKTKLISVLKSHKGSIAWSIAEMKGIDPSFYTHKILMEDEYKPTVQPQRRVNPNIKAVVKKEVVKLLVIGLIYPISNSPWVSLV
ncbi:hypothetical protein Tco_0670845 [Tanacetum coccineum]